MLALWLRLKRGFHALKFPQVAMLNIFIDASATNAFDRIETFSDLVGIGSRANWPKPWQDESVALVRFNRHLRELCDN
jgi:hypothetical protein